MSKQKNQLKVHLRHYGCVNCRQEARLSDLQQMPPRSPAGETKPGPSGHHGDVFGFLMDHYCQRGNFSVIRESVVLHQPCQSEGLAKTHGSNV